MKYFSYESLEFDETYAKAQKGSSSAMRVVAESLLRQGFDNPVSEDRFFSEALYWLDQAGEAGDIEAMKTLVRWRGGAVHYKLADDEEHRKWISTLAGLQSLPEMYMLGKILMVENNWVAGQEWWVSAARKRYIPAITALIEWAGSLGFTGASQSWMEYLRSDEAEFPEAARLVPKETSADEGMSESDTESFHEDETNIRPSLRLIRTPKDAEHVAAEWLRFFGFSDALVTGDGADGGIDVESDLAIAQVKFKGVQTGRPELQQLYGVSRHLEKHAFFFSLSDYSQVAIDFADETGISLFKFDYQGQPVAVNAFAENFLSGGESEWEEELDEEELEEEELEEEELDEN